MIIGAVVAGGIGILVGALLLADLPPDSSFGVAAPAHVSVALLAVGVVGAAAVSGSSSLRWVGVVALGAAAALGYRLFARVRLASTSGRDDSAREGRSSSSPALLVVHGLVAATAIALALLAAIRS
jgi:hypothetical protein